ncbi:MAG: serine/threonine-protein kinase [Pirellulaceae bacterium]
MENPTAEHRSMAPGLPRMEDVVRAFPQLEILEPIGHGGMGAVYRVRQVALDRFAALKLLNMRLADDPGFQERFAREARLMARLVHPNIATIFEFGQSGDFCYLLMQFIDGVNLRAAIKNQKLEPGEALKVIPQICDALQYAHDQGVIHRDIKPENILLDKYGNVKLVDFGLAKLCHSGESQPSLTGTQQVMGTVNYMAPEQWEGKGPVDHRADIYSLGVVFYEMLTGELPLGRFPEPSRKSKADARLDPIVMRTLEKDPGARYQSATDVKSAINESLVGKLPPQTSETSWTSDDRELVMMFQVGDNIEAWKTDGMARISTSGVHLEYHKLNKWFGNNDGVGNTYVPLNEINSVRKVDGPVTKGLEIRTRNLSCLGDFPGKKGIGIFLKTKSDELDRRNQVYEFLFNAIGQQEPSAAELETKRLKILDRIRIPIVNLLIVSVIDALAAVVCFVIAFNAWEIYFNGVSTINIGSVPKMAAHELAINSSLLGLGGVLASGFELAAWLMARTRRNYWFVFAVHIIMLVPIHPAWPLSLPLSIWGMIVHCTEDTYSLYAEQTDADLLAAKKTQ